MNSAESIFGQGSYNCCINNGQTIYKSQKSFLKENNCM